MCTPAEQLVYQLDRLPVTGRATAVDDRGPHPGQGRPDEVDGHGIPAHHDQQVARARPGDPATDRGVHEVDTARGQSLGEGAYGVRPHRAHDHNDRVRRQCGDGATEQGLLALVLVHDHHEQRVGVPGGLGRRRGVDRALGGQRLPPPGDGVEHRQRAGDVDETGRHRRPHRAEPDEPHSFQCHAFGLSRRMLTTRASVSASPTLPGKIT